VARWAAVHADPTRAVAEVARERLVTIEADQPRWLARHRMDAAGVRHILVLRQGELAGVLSLRDVMRLGRPADTPIPAGVRGPSPLSVGALLGQVPITVDASTSIRDAAQLMVRTGIGALPVFDEDEYLLGVVSRFDLLTAALAQPAP
jgi:CBS domain-containing protein